MTNKEIIDIAMQQSAYDINAKVSDFLQDTNVFVKSYKALKNIVASRPKTKVEMTVDGYTGFIMLDKNQKPKVALHIENEMR